MPDGRPKGSPSTRLEKQPPCGLAWPSPIRDRQDDSFEQQEVSGRDGSGWPDEGELKISALDEARWKMKEDGGAAEDIDRDGADDGGSDEPPKPDGWWKWTRTQKKNWKRRGGRVRSNS